MKKKEAEQKPTLKFVYEAPRLKPRFLLAQLHSKSCFADSPSAKKHPSTDKSVVFCFCYKNWQGETREREVVPIQLWYGHTDYHKEDQWLLKAFDIEKDAERDFALKDIQKFLNLQGETLRS